LLKIYIQENKFSIDMPYFPDLYDIQGSSGDLKKVNVISNNLIEEIHTYLGVKPGISKIS